jgi:hypothetical protein
MTALAASSFFGPLVNAPLIGVITMRTPEAIRAKVMTAVLTTAMLAGPAGMAVAGPLLQSWGPHRVFLLGRNRPAARDDPVRDRRVPAQRAVRGRGVLVGRRRVVGRLDHVAPEVVEQLHALRRVEDGGKVEHARPRRRALPASVSW